MASRVLRELEELRSMLAQPTPTLSGSPVAAAVPSLSHLSAPLLLPTVSAAQTPSYSTYSFQTPLSASPGASVGSAGPCTAANFTAAPYTSTSSAAAAGPFFATGLAAAGLGPYSAAAAAAAPLGAAAVRGSPRKFATFPGPDGSSRTAERLGRALEAAEEEMDAAMARQADIINSQLRAREVDLSEAQRVAAAAQAEVSVLRSQLAAAKQAAAAEAAAADSRMASKEAELSAVQAELIAVRAEADDLKQRLADGHAALDRADAALSSHTNDLSRRLQAAAADAEAAAAAAAWERQHKESALVQLSECQAELDAVRAQLVAAAEELQHAHRQAALESESRHQLESALKGTAAAAATLKEAKDLEINELRQRLRAERNVRKACEAWLQGELRSREEMEGLLQAVRDMTGASASRAQQTAAAGAGGGGGQSIGSNSSSSTGGSNTAAVAAAMAVDVAGLEALLAHLSDEPKQQQQQQQQRRAGQLSADSAAATAAASVDAAVAAAGSISRLLAGEAQANKARTEFVQMKAALGEDSRRLKAELEAAKQMLRSRVAARRNDGAVAAAAAGGSLGSRS